MNTQKKVITSQDTNLGRSMNDFFSRIQKVGDCWIWSRRKDACGYGQITLSGVSTKAHRVSYRVFIGVIPDGMNVLHRCDTPACVNPDHLFLGTRSDNMRDMYAKGRGWPRFSYERALAARGGRT